MSITPLFERALATPAEEATATDERILDAALELVGAYGVKRTSMDDIAKRAGINRRTIFRRFGTKEGVVDALVVREVRRLLARVGDVARSAPDPAASVAEVFVTLVRWAHSHPLVDRMARVEPQRLIESLRAENPPLMELARAFVAQRIRSGQRRGAVPKRDADQLADVLIRLGLSYVLIPTPHIDIDDEDALRALAHAAIAPILTGRA